MQLHWKNDVLTIRGIPRGWRYFVADCHQKDLVFGDKTGHLANEISDGNEIRVPLLSGNFLFRARIGNPDIGRNYEFEGATDMLPVELFHRPESWYCEPLKRTLVFEVCDHRPAH